MAARLRRQVAWTVRGGGTSSTRMARGSLSAFRMHRRGIVQAVLFALLLPLLLGLAPQPSLSASAALERDLALSICSSSSADHPVGQEQHGGAHQHCILCASCAAAHAPLLAGGAAAFAPKPLAEGARPVPPQAGLAFPLRALLDARPPRGPPAQAA